MQIKQFLIAVCIGLMFAACSNEETPTQNLGGIPINFTANIQNLVASVGTRVADGTTGMVNTNFPENSQIQVAIKEYGSTDCYITNSSSTWEYTSTSEKMYLPYNATSKTIGAFYPVPSTSTYQLLNNMGYFQVSSDQSDIDNYKSSDFLGAVATVTKENVGAVELNFKHLGSKVIVNVYNGSNRVSGYTITMKDVYRKATLDGSNNPIKVLSQYLGDKGPVIFGVSSSSAGQAAIIIPQTINSGVALFEVTKDGVTYTFTTTESITLKSGYSYTFNLKFENTEIGFGSVIIGSGWGSDPDKSTPIEGTLSEQTT